MKIVADEAIAYVKDYFGPLGELILKNGRAITKEDVKTADILLVRAVTRVDAALLADTSVRFVGTVTAGEDHLDQHWLKQAGIQWATAAGFNAPAVADYVIAVVAALQRQQRLPAKRFKAAIIGCGKVGQAVAKALAALDVELVLCDPIRAESEQDFRHTDLHAIADVDFISLHVPLTFIGPHATHYFIDRNFLSRQKSGCVLLNASRGEVLNTKDLLNHGKHLTECLDVWEHEPHIDTTLLQQVFIATPHIAGYSVQGKIRGIAQIYEAACQQSMIQPKAAMLVPAKTMPTQTLTFAGENHHWQDIVLGVFNPLTMTAIMRTALLSSDTPAEAFDHLRKEFTYRHEFAYTNIAVPSLLAFDKEVLERLGVKVQLGSGNGNQKSIYNG